MADKLESRVNLGVKTDEIGLSAQNSQLENWYFFFKKKIFGTFSFSLDQSFVLFLELPLSSCGRRHRIAA